MESIKCSGSEISAPALPSFTRRIFFFSNARTVGYHTVPTASVNLMSRNFAVCAAVFAALTAAVPAAEFRSSGPTVSGTSARLRGKVAAAPENAPITVKKAIWAANQLHMKPYRYGGGHKSFSDSAYDCSGTVSYALGGAGVIRSPMSSSEFRNFGQKGRGKWITIYARNGHTFAVIAGLRLDTTPYVTGREKWAPGWQSTFRAPSGFEARHPDGL